MNFKQVIFVMGQALNTAADKFFPMMQVMGMAHWYARPAKGRAWWLQR